MGFASKKKWMEVFIDGTNETAIVLLKCMTVVRISLVGGAELRQFWNTNHVPTTNVDKWAIHNKPVNQFNLPMIQEVTAMSLLQRHDFKTFQEKFSCFAVTDKYYPYHDPLNNWYNVGDEQPPIEMPDSNVINLWESTDLIDCLTLYAPINQRTIRTRE